MRLKEELANMEANLGIYIRSRPNTQQHASTPCTRKTPTLQANFHVITQIGKNCHAIQLSEGTKRISLLSQLHRVTVSAILYDLLPNVLSLPRQSGPWDEADKLHSLWPQPGSSYFVVLGHSSFCGINMSPKCIKISTCVCFLVYSFGLLVLAATFVLLRSDIIDFPRGWGLRDATASLTFQVRGFNGDSHERVIDLRDMSTDQASLSSGGKLNTPSLEAYIRASPGVEGQELRLSGLAVYSKLANACQPLVDISKSKFQGIKIAVISLDEFASPICTLQDLAINSQNAGYSVLIFYCRPVHCFSEDTGTQTDTNKLLIPVLNASYLPYNVDRRNVDISVKTAYDPLSNMQSYLSNLHFWFLLGPVITLDWLIRKKKLCFMSGALPQDHEESAIGNERSVRNGEEGGLRSETQEPVANYDLETEHDQTGGEEQPLIVVINDPRTNLMTTTSHGTRAVVLLREIFGKLAVGCGYVILIVVALPVGISSGGWSFFRFDENEKLGSKSFWDGFLKLNDSTLESLACGNVSATCIRLTILDSFLPLWWSSLRIFCFFLYSRFVCKTTWTIPSNFSKLIRSDWFASNMYLLILGVVVPYCSFAMTDISYVNRIGDNVVFGKFSFVGYIFPFTYFASYNMICTICNVLFVIILNKHKFVTRYVFYISVCMICAYIESDIVAVFYFMLNSEGSLTNLKLTALRTVAIGLTLTLSFSSSMHIIRKLKKPQESLFEGLSEK